MFRLDAGPASSYCDGLPRRNFLQFGLAGISLPSLLAAREAAAGTNRPAAKDTAVILIWLDGGPSHIDTYDMKPDAPPEVRGIWQPTKTNVPGMHVTELFPRQAQVADKFSVLRSLHHDNGDHFTGGHFMLTGRGGASGTDTAGKYPSLGAIATKMAGPRQPGMLPYVAIPHASCIGIRPGYFGANYLGVQNNPFETEGDPNAEKFQVRNMALAGGLTLERLADRRVLVAQLDAAQRNFDAAATTQPVDKFQQAAFEMVSGAAARQAFDINQETAATRELYGRHTLGQSCLLARRLVEAGSTFITVFSGGWDHHWDMQKGYERLLPQVDSAVAGLLTDLDQRGLLTRTLVMLCGEFGRTPKMNDGSNRGTPGRDHWGNGFSCLLAGGGVQGGRMVGSTNRLGECPLDLPVKPADLHATVYDVLGIDPSVQFVNNAGRPVPAIDDGKVIRELF